MDIAVPHYVYSCILLLFLFVQCASGFLPRGDDGYRRQVSLELNPGLEPPLTPPPGIGLVHIRALGQNDTLHFLFCSLGAPALLLVHTNSTTSSVQVDWPEFLKGNVSGRLRIEPESSVQYSSALVLTRLWEYDDVNDTANPELLPPYGFFPPYDLGSFTWGDLNKTVNLTDHTAQLCGRDHTESFNNGSFCIKFSAFEKEGREQMWPSLLHSANSSQLRVWLDGVAPRSNTSRFMLELQSVLNPEFHTGVSVVKSIDDEYTPAIFHVAQWVSSPSNTSSSILSYTQWKPVAYRKATPVFEDATPCKNSEPVSMATLPQSGLVLAYFAKDAQAFGLNITFSIAGDPFYNTTNFLTWTILMGLGSPPVDRFSPLVIAIMAIGLGTPLALILLGGLFICIRKKTAEPHGYAPMN